MAAPSPKQDPSIPKFEQQTLYIAGQRHSTQETFQTIDPATDKPIADVSKADRHSIDAAVRAGQAAFPTWSATPAIERSRILLRAVALLRERNDELAAAAQKAQFLANSMHPIMQFIGSLSYVAIAVLGGLKVASGRIKSA